MYLEFFILIFDYYKTLNKRVFLYEWILSILIGVAVFYILSYGNSTNSTKVFKDSAINLLGILAGFSITIITILTTGQSKNLEEIKKKETNFVINGKKISLFRLLLINFTYSVILESFLIIFCLTYPIILENFKIEKTIKYLFFSMLVGTIVHLLLLTIRNLTDFYLIITKTEK